jgi:hypothetical protein
MEPRYPDVEVKLTGTDSNVFMLAGQVTRALRIHGVEHADIAEFMEELMNTKSYDEALQVMMRWVHVY